MGLLFGGMAGGGMVRITETEMPGTSCPSCSKRLEVATGIGVAKPKPGNVTVCLYCGHVLVFGEGLTLREPTSKEMHQIAGNKEVLAMVEIAGRVRNRYQ